MERRKDSKGRVLEKGESQRKDGTYVFQYSYNNSRRSVYAKTLNDLRKKEKQIKRDIEDSVTPYDYDITLNDVFDKRIKVAQIRETTKTSYLYAWNSKVRKSALGDLRIRCIKKSDILSFCNELISLGYSNATVRNIIYIISSCFEFAIDDDLVKKNPCNGLAEKYESIPDERHALTHQEQEEFLNFVKNSAYYSKYYPMFVVMLRTAVRCGEILGLTWNDIDFNKKTININHQLIYSSIKGKYIFCAGKLKSESGKRVIPMTSDVCKVLKERKAEQIFNGSRSKVCIDGYSDFVFTTVKGNKGNVLCRQFVDATLSRIVKAYNKQENKPIVMPHISAHILRHTGCTRMGEVGIDPKVMQYLMGHSDMNITMKIYNHISEERNRKEICKLENAI